ncbi:MAG TPA: DUF1269 domain-containing protein [Thermoleophilaceae bacterium]|nr:DUF1269 domain-containing protein [Thermoleophilaceae bacterium]
MDNVIAVSFTEDANAYEALTKLRELNDQGRIDLAGGAVVTREADGQVVIKDEVGDIGYVGTATGGTVGVIIGILGGPLGVLLGGATGVLVGSLFDLADTEDAESVLEQISRSVRTDHTSLIAEVSEGSPDVVNAAMDSVGGSVIRRSVYDVEGEIAYAEEAQRAAKQEARKQMREQRREERKENFHEKVAELKSKLHIDEPVEAGGS